MNRFACDRSALIAQHLADVEPSTTGVLFVDLVAIARNYGSITLVCPSAECGGVVKADAYGLGLAQVAPALAKAGCKTFFVATLSEAETLRSVIPKARIIVLNGLLPGTARYFGMLGVQPTLNSLAEVREWQAHCGGTGVAGEVVVQFDTGMTRLGLTPEECLELSLKTELAEFIGPSVKMSHLACADDQTHEENSKQLTAFQEIVNRFGGPGSLANSAGAKLASDYHFDLVRLGIALYGGRAVTGAPNLMSPTVHLYGRILQVRETSGVTHVGYGAAHRLSGPRRLATVAAGYADGYFRHLSACHAKAGGVVFIDGCAAPVVGRISMDLTVVDVSKIPASKVSRGGWVELIGSAITIDDVADYSGTIGYEVLTALGRRYRRIYFSH